MEQGSNLRLEPLRNRTASVGNCTNLKFSDRYGVVGIYQNQAGESTFGVSPCMCRSGHWTFACLLARCFVQTSMTIRKDHVSGDRTLTQYRCAEISMMHRGSWDRFSALDRGRLMW